MSANTGRWAAYAFSLWLALYIGTGTAAAHHDEAEAAAWAVLCATMLMLPASADTHAERCDVEQAQPARVGSAVAKPDAQGPSQ